MKTIIMKAITFIVLFSVSTLLIFSQEPVLPEEKGTTEEISRIVEGHIYNAQYQKALEVIEKQLVTSVLTDQKILCYMALKDYTKAIELLKLLSGGQPDDISLRLRLASCYEMASQYQQAIDCYDDMIKRDTTNAYLKIQKADLLYQLEKYHSALDQYRDIENTYNSNYLMKRLAICFEKLNQTDSAKIYYSRAWEMDPADNFSAVSLVKLQIKQEDFDSALRNTEAFIARDSTNSQMNVLNAFIYYSKDMYEEGVSRFEKCRLQGDSSLMVNRGLGISYYFLQEDAKAQPYLDRSFAQDSTNNVVLYAMASVDFNLGYYPESIRCYKTLIERVTTDKNVFFTYHSNLAKALENNAQYREACSGYVTAISYASTNTQKMELNFAVSNLCENQLKDYSSATYFYSQYRVNLVNYQTNLELKAMADSTAIKDVEERISELDKHIEHLKSLKNANN